MLNETNDTGSHPSPEIVDAQLVAPEWARQPSAMAPAQQQWGSIVVSWMIIGAITGFVFVLNNFARPTRQAGEQTARRLELAQVNLMSKVIVGIQELSGNRGFGIQNLGDVDNIVSHRLSRAILLNELYGASPALRALDALKSDIARGQVTASESDVKLLRSLEQLFADYRQDNWSGSSLTPDEKGELVESLGWSGKLALAPPETNDFQARKAVLAESRSSVFIAGSVMIAAVVILLGGIVVFVVGTVGLALRRIKLRFDDRSVRRHSIFAETFALWFVLFLVLSFVAGYFDFGRWELLASGVPFLLSLIALAWPLFRGAAGEEIAAPIGWNLSNPIVEVGSGLLGYLFCVPIFLAGLIGVFLLWSVDALVSGGTGSLMLAAQNSPMHPIISDILSGDPVALISALVVAALVAPLVEETMFRGVLYRHLRSGSRRLPRFVSVVISAGLTGLIFGLIHPQGFIAVPGLAALGFGFALIREWRNSLIATMTMHAVHNGTLLGLAILLLQ